MQKITFVLHESHRQSTNAEVASPVFCLLASVEGTTLCLEILLQSPPPPRGDCLLATPPTLGDWGDCKGGEGTNLTVDRNAPKFHITTAQHSQIAYLPVALNAHWCTKTFMRFPPFSAARM